MTIERDYSDKDLRAALGSSPPLEKMMTHTETPWQFVEATFFGSGYSRIVGGFDGDANFDGTTRYIYEHVADVIDNENEQANGELIVTAVNSHASNLALITDLVDALQVCLGHLTGGLDGDWRDCDPAELAREVLARAKASHGAGT